VSDLPGEAEAFYRALLSQGKTVRVGMEASGHGRWFERLMAELQIELWIGDASPIWKRTAKIQARISHRSMTARRV
jgi:hypothetical protein